MGFPGVSDGKESACNEGDPGSIPGLGTSPRKWQPTPVSSSAEFHGRKSWAGYSPWDHRVGNDCATQHNNNNNNKLAPAIGRKLKMQLYN